MLVDDVAQGGVEGRLARQDEFERYVDDFLGYLVAVRNLSPNTVRAYGTDLHGADPFGCRPHSYAEVGRLPEPQGHKGRL